MQTRLSTYELDFWQRTRGFGFPSWARMVKSQLCRLWWVRSPKQPTFLIEDTAPWHGHTLSSLCAQSHIIRHCWPNGSFLTCNHYCYITEDLALHVLMLIILCKALCIITDRTGFLLFKWPLLFISSSSLPTSATFDHLFQCFGEIFQHF